MNNIFNNDKNKCCGCEACVSICPKKAIKMEADEYGYIYPAVDDKKCINCGLCKKVCLYQNIIKYNEVKKSLVAMNKDNVVLNNSSSGGIFYSLANAIIKNNGIVYGCSLFYKNDKLDIEHIRITEKKDIKKIQGSKYVKSSIFNTYNYVCKDLQEGKEVLFTGTPCQISAIKNYLKTRRISTEKIFFVDIICHGVPSLSFFDSYIKEIEDKKKIKIIDFIFRDKSSGWGLKGKAVGLNKKKKKIELDIYGNTSSYYNYFLTGLTYRDNCYSCMFAKKERVSDITIGDFWGIEKEYPNLLKDNNGDYDPDKGISCVLLNNEKGELLFERIKEDLLFEQVNFESIAKHNAQLNKPNKCKEKERKIILDNYREHGYKGVEKRFIKDNFSTIIIKGIVHRIPVGLRKKVKKIINK